MPSKTAFLDRDGTIIEEKDFIKTPDQIEFIPGSVDAVKILRDLGYKIIVISNQSGVGRGILTEQMVRRVNESFLVRLREEDAPADGLYFCPHNPEDGCDCRKPTTGMIKKAVLEHKLNLRDAVVIGDKLTDVELGKNIGAKTILVLTGYGKKELDKLVDMVPSRKPDFVAANLLDAARWLKSSGE
ncbi:MAG: HAD family hydrolase [Candidatus Zixiibacteriota bacterium]